MPVVLVGHVTKDGTLAGPKTLEHLVDAVLDPGGRALRDHPACCARRRTGSARPRRSASSRWPAHGLAEVADPAIAFLCAPNPATSGRTAGSGHGGHARGQPTAAGRGPGAGGAGRCQIPRRTASGPDASRLALLIAVLGRRAGHRPRRRRRVRLAGRRPERRRAGDRPAAGAGHSPPRSGTDRSTPSTVAWRRGRPARRAATRHRPRPAAARGGPARVRPGDRAQRRRSADGRRAWLARGRPRGDHCARRSTSASSHRSRARSGEPVMQGTA